MRPGLQPRCLSLGQIREFGCRMARDLEVAILFADVVGSTQLYDKFGDTKASETVAVCLDAMKDATMQFDGTVIKTIGDEVMSTFPSVDQAMRAAVMMQSRITSDSRREDTIPVSIRIGCHYGPVVQEQNDIFGAAVHTANRMTSQAKAKQIVISGETVSLMSPELKKQTRQIDVATVRGRLDEVALYELLWNPEEATSMLPTIEWENRKASRLTLSFRDQTVELDDKRKSVTLGRADDNDLVIKGNLISRIHAKIEMRRGKFVLIDQSTNGTFIENVQGEERFVRRDTTELHGEGVIGLGRAEKAEGREAFGDGDLDRAGLEDVGEVGGGLACHHRQGHRRGGDQGGQSFHGSSSCWMGGSGQAATAVGAFLTVPRRFSSRSARRESGKHRAKYMQAMIG